jgi:ribonuclease BN (tRNA processing enzyme)
MKLRVLGYSGGIGGSLHTTSFLVDQDILVDAGTGAGELSLAELAAIDHVFITHSHMDHICSLPLMLDSIAGMRKQPVTVYAIGEVLKILKEHVFNWRIWPDFSEIYSGQHAVMRYQEIAEGEVIDLEGRKIAALPAVHTVPAVGFHLDSGQGSLVFSGDTYINDGLWKAVNRIDNLRYLIVETAFSNHEEQLAVLSRHLCPSLLAGELEKYQGDAEIFITHLKPDEVELIMAEIKACAGRFNPKMLMNNQVLVF